MITFKQIENTEIKELASLASSIWHEYWTCILSNEQIDYMVDNFQSEKAIKNQIENENYTYYFILFENRRVGYFGVSDKHHSEDNNNFLSEESSNYNSEKIFRSAQNDCYLFLSKLYIKKEFRHHGIGAKAFEKIREIADGRKIQLTVNKYNTNTIKAYEKWGFKTVNSVVTDIGSGFVMDDYIMENV